MLANILGGADFFIIPCDSSLAIEQRTSTQRNASDTKPFCPDFLSAASAETGAVYSLQFSTGENRLANCVVDDI